LWSVDPARLRPTSAFTTASMCTVLEALANLLLTCGAPGGYHTSVDKKRKMTSGLGSAARPDDEDVFRLSASDKWDAGIEAGLPDVRLLGSTLH